MINRHKSVFQMNSHERAREIERLQQINHHDHFNLNKYEETQIQLLPDKAMAPAQFRPDPLDPKKFWAHPITLRAVRKEVFLAAECMDELEEMHQCRSCAREIDLQFWIFCPYCEAWFKV